MCLWALNRTLTFHNASSVLSVDKNIRLWNTFYCYRTKNHCSSLPYCILSLHKEVFMCRTVYFITWASMCVPNNWHTATALDSLSLLYYYSKLSVFVTKYTVIALESLCAKHVEKLTTLKLFQNNFIHNFNL